MNWMKNKEIGERGIRRKKIWKIRKWSKRRERKYEELFEMRNPLLPFLISWAEEKDRSKGVVWSKKREQGERETVSWREKGKGRRWLMARSRVRERAWEVKVFLAPALTGMEMSHVILKGLRELASGCLCPFLSVCVVCMCVCLIIFA